MADQEISVGDVVVLNSGGPAMTVTYINDKGGLTAKWFSGHQVDWIDKLNQKAVKKLEKHTCSVLNPLDKV